MKKRRLVYQKHTGVCQAKNSSGGKVSYQARSALGRSKPRWTWKKCVQKHYVGLAFWVFIRY